MSQATQSLLVETQVVVQYMMANSCVEEEEFEAFLMKISGANQINPEKIYQLVQQVNKKITRFNLMIRRTVDDITTKKYYILISTVDNVVTREAVQYGPKQYEFFKFTLKAIVDDPRGIISERTLKEMAEKASVSVVGKARNSLPEYKILFDEWVSKNWLFRVVEDNVDYLTLGVRSIAELDVFIKTVLLENADDLNCQSCESMSIYSVLCPRCDARYHKRCSKMSIDPETKMCRSCPDTAPTIDSRPCKSRKISN